MTTRPRTGPRLRRARRSSAAAQPGDRLRVARPRGRARRTLQRQARRSTMSSSAYGRACPRTTRSRARSAAGRWLPATAPARDRWAGAASAAAPHWAEDQQATADGRAAGHGAAVHARAARAVLAARRDQLPRGLRARDARAQRTGGPPPPRVRARRRAAGRRRLRAQPRRGSSSSRCRARRRAQAAARQVERILSLDVDGTGFPDVGERDPAIGRLQARYPGLRPVGFPSPFEAGAWFVVSQRIRAAQGVALKARLSDELGERVAICGEERVAFPAPGVIADLEAVAGLPERKLATLRALAQAAVEARSTANACAPWAATPRWRSSSACPESGRSRRRASSYAGPASPTTSQPPSRAWRARRRSPTASTRPCPADELTRRAEAWRPYRSWVGVLLRLGLEDASQGSRGLLRAPRPGRPARAGAPTLSRPRGRGGPTPARTLSARARSSRAPSAPATLGRAGQAAAAGETTRRGKSGHHRARWSGDRPGETRGKVPQKHTADGGASAEPRTGKVEMVR